MARSVRRIVARFAVEGKPDPLAEIARLQSFRAPAARAFGPTPERALPASRVNNAQCFPLRILVEGGRAMLATRPKRGLFCAMRRFHDQRQWYPSHGGCSAPAQRSGAIYQGPLLREPECAGFAAAARKPAADQYPDQCWRQP